MNPRKGLTLLEVLMAIFIMGIGMLSVLAMFPAAADMMGRAISNAQMAEGLVNARAMHDGVDWTSSAYSKFIAIPSKNTGTVPGWTNFPAGETPVFLFLDQYAALSGVTRYNQCLLEVASLNAFANPPLNSISIDATSGNPSQAQIAGRFFTCNSDVVLSKFGLANKDDDGIAIPADREGKFTLAYFFSQPMPISSPGYFKRNILVFKDRSQSLSASEFSWLSVAGVTSSNQIQVTKNPAVTLKSRQWVMVTDSLPTAYPTAVDFLEIRSVDDSAATTIDLELSPALTFTPQSLYLLKDVARVALIGS